MCRRAHDQCRMSGRPRFECGVEQPQRRYAHLLSSLARAWASRTGGDTRACAHAMLHTRKSATKDTETRRCASATVGTKAIVDTETCWRAAARDARLRDARARAACTSRFRGRRLHGVGRGARHAAVGVAQDGRGRGGGARACRRLRDSEALGVNPQCRCAFMRAVLLDVNRAKRRLRSVWGYEPGAGGPRARRQRPSSGSPVAQGGRRRAQGRPQGGTGQGWH
jgi:hypothetical protein